MVCEYSATTTSRHLGVSSPMTLGVFLDLYTLSPGTPSAEKATRTSLPSSNFVVSSGNQTGKTQIRAGLQHDDHARMMVTGDLFRRRRDEAHVRILSLVQRRRTHTNDGIGLAEYGRVHRGRQLPTLDVRREVRRGHADVRLTGIEQPGIFSGSWSRPATRKPVRANSGTGGRPT